MARIKQPHATYLACAILALVLILAGFAQTSPGKSVSRSLGLASAPASYTDLYFSDQSEIADSTQGFVPPGARSRSQVSFVIHNAGRRARVYSWTVASDGLTAASGRTRIGPRTADLIDRSIPTRCVTRTVRTVKVAGRRHRISKSVRPARVLISVVLAAPHLTIDFWVQCHGVAS